MSNTILLPLQPGAMSPAQLAAVFYLARYSGHTHQLYAYQLRRWSSWCETNRLDPLVGIQRAHVELYIRHLGETGLRVSSVNTMMHGVVGSSGSPTSTASSPPTRPSTPDCQESTRTKPGLRAWTVSS